MKFKFFILLISFALKISSFKILFFTTNPIVSLIVSNVIYGYFGFISIFGIFLASLIITTNPHISVLHALFVIISTPLFLAITSNIKYLIKRYQLKYKNKNSQSMPKLRSFFTNITQNIQWQEQTMPFLIKKALPNNLLKILTSYVLSKYHNDFYIESKNHQVPGSKAVYGEILIESLLEHLTPMVENATGLELWPTYSTCRVYEKNQKLPKHHDRYACEITATVTLWVDKTKVSQDHIWPIYIKQKNQKNYQKFMPETGDVLIYKGAANYHYRDKLEALQQIQILLHYVNKNGPYKKYKYDLRKNLGCPELNALSYFLKSRF